MVSEGKIRVLIADDQEIIRHGLAMILRNEPDMDVVGLANDGAEAVALAAQLQPDVILMDIVMPNLNGIAATRQIVSQMPNAGVIILTTYDADDMVFEGVRAGAMCYLLKGARSDAVLAAIRSVHHGESHLDAGVARKVMDEFRRLSGLAEPADAGKPADDIVVGGRTALGTIRAHLANLLAGGFISEHDHLIATKLARRASEARRS